MAGTKSGGIKTAATNKAKYGSDYYSKIGRRGGKRGRTGGFAYSPEKAAEAGKKGGRLSRIGMVFQSETNGIRTYLVKKTGDFAKFKLDENSGKYERICD